MHFCLFTDHMKNLLRYEYEMIKQYWWEQKKTAEVIWFAGYQALANGREFPEVSSIHVIQLRRIIYNSYEL